MILARVVGNVVATQKNERYQGARIMVCQPLDLRGQETGATVLALDSAELHGSIVAGEGLIISRAPRCRSREGAFR